MSSVAFVINQGLVRDRRALVRRCRAAAEGEGFQATIAETGSVEDGLRAVREAVAAGARLVFAAGGDGTVRACAQVLEGTGVPLAIVPLGTANLVARALGVPDRIGPALRAGFRGRDRLIDLACVEDPGGVVFVAMAGIGLDAAVVRAARGDGKRRLGWVAYLGAGARVLGGGGAGVFCPAG
jgi:diacylglycerol kinase family enzyme